MMKHGVVPGLVVAALVAWLGADVTGVLAASAQVEQSVTLRPGWNAVFLEVQPDPGAPAEVFGGLPVKSVWTWVPRTSTVEYIQDPSEERLRAEGWHVWFPLSAGKPAQLTNLFELQANRGYLVELAGERPATFTVRGAPLLRREAWVPDSFAFTGFTVDRAAPPTFAAFFAASPAHAGQPVYLLGDDGSWHPVDNQAATAMRPGEAFWIFTRGASTYAGPLEVQPDHGDALEFSRLVPELGLRVRNAAAQPKTVALRQAGTEIPLSRKRLSSAGLPLWPTLGVDGQVALAPQTEARIPLALRQADVPAGGAVAVLEVTDGEGSLLRVPVSAAAPLLTAAGAPDYRGLWLGTVTVNAVTEAQIPARAEFTAPQPAGQDFTFRIILHVGAGGTVRLLKEVTQMWQKVPVACTNQPGSTCLCPATNPAATCDQGHYVLVTDESLIPRFSPATLLGGQPFSYRVSTAAFDFPGFEAAMTGEFSSAGGLTCTIGIPADLSTNPFLHRYHPDHDNLDEQGRPITDERLLEAFPVTRNLTLSFSANDPECAGVAGCENPPDWLVDRMGGSYREQLGGLHRNAITVAGIFTLKRVTDVAELNPVPVP